MDNKRNSNSKINSELENRFPITAPSRETMAPHKNQANDKISAAGIANATAGSLIADLIKLAFQGKGNQPASKNDIIALINNFERYHRITNLPSKHFGKSPYFDLHTSEVVYF